MIIKFKDMYETKEGIVIYSSDFVDNEVNKYTYLS